MIMQSLIILAAALFSTTAFSADLATKHKAVGLTAQPQAAQCLACHGSYQALGEKTASLTPNPHASHMGEVQCDGCHRWKGKGKLMCNDCHRFPALQKGLSK